MNKTLNMCIGRIHVRGLNEVLQGEGNGMGGKEGKVSVRESDRREPCLEEKMWI